MDRFWLEKAHKYITEHNAFDDVSEIEIDESDSIARISAKVTVNLPSRFIKVGITEIGVKKKEDVFFLFSSSFPLKAPTIQLRDDFPRCFPHINPSEKRVLPCIYEGNLSELLQQAGWMNEILNQLVDWLEKAASNDLLNYEQGWEPMRNDRIEGFIRYDIDEVLSAFKKEKASALIRGIEHIKKHGFIIAGSISKSDNVKKAQLVIFSSPKVIDNYVPNNITNLGQLYDYANSIGLSGLKDTIKEIDIGNVDDDKLFVIFAIKRPINIIGTASDIEFLNFVINKKIKHRIKKGRELKRTLPDCKVGMLSHVSPQSPALLQRISGIRVNKNEMRPIALLGCGSMGSKIGMHLARNGNGPFRCIDNDIFMPHNNARHALTFTYTENKAELLSLSIINIGKVPAEPVKENALNVDYSNSRIIIDTAASLSVRNILMSRPDLPSVISCGLYMKGRCGLLLIENKDMTSRLTAIWAFLYYMSLSDTEIRKILYSRNLDDVLIGQSCSSQTLVVDDARISLMAATMSLRIQGVLEDGLPENSEILISEYNDNYSLTSRTFTVPGFTKLESNKERDWNVYISGPVIDKMREVMHEKEPNETGGALLGSVFLYPNAIVITGLIKAPPDSIETPALFVMGIEGLEKEIKKTERMTKGKVTYLGTWHSHPHGGGASSTDKGTFRKLLFVRNYEPTVCLIITESHVIMV
jgi:Prokaryotic E2 family A/Prokaryotic homologs of the JAB domain